MINKSLYIETLKSDIADIILNECNSSKVFYQIINMLEEKFFKWQLISAQSIIETYGKKHFLNSNCTVANCINQVLSNQ